MISNTDSVGSGHPGDTNSAENSTRTAPPSSSPPGADNAPSAGDVRADGNPTPLSIAEHRLGGAVVRSSLEAVVGVRQPAGSSPDPTLLSKADWQRRALAAAGIDPTKWNPSQGFGNNKENVQKVYDYYAKLYKDHPELRWAGMARLAGGTVYGGLQKIDTAEKIAEIGTLVPFPFPNPIAGVGKHELDYLENKLLQMQKDIFVDLAWQHQAYAEGGIGALRASYLKGEISADNYKAWLDIASGDENRIWDGNTALLKREQFDVIQHHYADIQGRFVSGPLLSQAMSVLAESPIPGGRSFHDVVPNGDITKFEDRWKWIQSDMLPRWRSLAPEYKRALVDQPLQQLADRDFVPDPTQPAPPTRRSRPWWVPIIPLPPILPWRLP